MMFTRAASIFAVVQFAGRFSSSTCFNIHPYLRICQYLSIFAHICPFLSIFVHIRPYFRHIILLKFCLTNLFPWHTILLFLFLSNCKVRVAAH